MIASPSSGAYSDYPAERAREGRLIGKPGQHCDFDDRCGRLPEQFLGMLNAMPNQPLVG
jgi:hypothetical protein